MKLLAYSRWATTNKDWPLNEFEYFLFTLSMNEDEFHFRFRAYD